MSDFLFTPFNFPFMQTAMVAALAIAVVCGLTSCFLVMKGWSMMGDAISHAVLPGIVLAVILGVPLLLGALVSGLICAILAGVVRSNSIIKQDTALGIVFTGMFSLGLLMFAAIETDQHLQHILFGNLMGLPLEIMAPLLVTASLVTLLLLVFKKSLVLWVFDTSHASTIGMPIQVIHLGFLTMLAATIVSALHAVGVVLVVAMLVAPGLTAQLVTHRFDHMLVISVLSAVASSFIGLILSFHWDAATGPTIVLVQGFFFLVSLCVNKYRLAHHKPTESRTA
uniref:metal ABC transporter permease n=1 Tax=Thaumasiovibrio occultus TaxID=1891184 RepID=UPI000B357E73|nr:metal ABC transporter permease [Thaumasiovibrio occultus]